MPPHAVAATEARGRPGGAAAPPRGARARRARARAVAVVTAVAAVAAAACGEIKARETAAEAQPAELTTAPPAAEPTAASAPPVARLLQPELAAAIAEPRWTELSVALAGCESYDAEVGAWLRTLDARVRSGVADQTAPRAMATFMAAGATALEAVRPEGEQLARGHAVLTAAVTDLAEAFGELAEGAEAGDAEAARQAMERLENGGANLELAVAEVHRTCG